MLYISPLIKKGNNYWSIMVADTLNELLFHAGAIGLKKKWFYKRGTKGVNYNHYYLPEANRQLAIAKGAISVTFKEMKEIISKVKLQSNEIHPLAQQLLNTSYASLYSERDIK